MSAYDRYRDLVGLKVVGSDGGRLGKVLECGEQQFLVERALLHTDYFIDYAEVDRVSEGRVSLRLPASHYRHRGPRRTEGPSASNSASTGFSGSQE